MPLIYSQIKSQAGTLCDRVDSSYLTKIDGWCNQRYVDIIQRRPWMALLRQIQVSCVAAQNYIIMPQEVDQVIDVHQRATPVIVALKRYYNRLKGNLAGYSDSGPPVEMNPMGWVGIKVALPSTGTITIESSSASDTTQKLRIHGYDSNKLPVTEQLTLNGTTAVPSTISLNHEEGYEPTFSKDGATVGTISIKRSSTTIAEIPPRDLTVRYMKWLVSPTPTTSTILYLTFKKRVRKLEYDEDVPEIECENALIRGAFAQALSKKRQFAKAQVEWEGYEAAIAVLTEREPKFDENFQDQWFPTIQRDPIDQHHY